MYYLSKAGMFACILFLNVYSSDQSVPDLRVSSDLSERSNLPQVSQLSSELNSPRPVLQDGPSGVRGIVKDIIKGSLMGFAEVAFPGQILSYGMNRAIDGKPFRVTQSYRGFWPHALGEMPITVIQTVARSQAERALRAYEHAGPSEVQKLGISYMAGVLGAIADTPCCAVQLYQQDQQGAGKSLVQVLRLLGKGAWRGYVPNALLKEGPFTVGYQVLALRAKEAGREHWGQSVMSELICPVAVGMVTAVVTQPGAVLRNTMQGTLLGQDCRYFTIRQIAADIYAKKGLSGFFVGGLPRGLRVTITVPLFAYYEELLERCLRKG